MILLEKIIIYNRNKPYYDFNRGSPFGGIKHSGVNKEAGYQGIEAYLDTKYTCIANNI